MGLLTRIMGLLISPHGFWSLPVVFVIENNQYGMGTKVTRAAAGRALADRGMAYGIPGKQVDGMDVLAVRTAALEALAHCRDVNGPYILEMKTYRYRGHSMSDPAKYRTREEVDAMRKQHDPIGWRQRRCWQWQ